MLVPKVPKHVSIFISIFCKNISFAEKCWDVRRKDSDCTYWTAYLYAYVPYLCNRALNTKSISPTIWWWLSMLPMLPGIKFFHNGASAEKKSTQLWWGTKWDVKKGNGVCNASECNIYGWWFGLRDYSALHSLVSPPGSHLTWTSGKALGWTNRENLDKTSPYASTPCKCRGADFLSSLSIFFIRIDLNPFIDSLCKAEFNYV